MIGLTRLKRAIADVPAGGMQTGDPKVRLKLCDAQRIEVEYNALISERDNAWQELREIREAIGANPEESTADEVRRVVAERDKALAQSAEQFGDGYYDGFIDGVKHHEDTDCNTDPDYLGDEAMRCSEIAEQEKSTRIGILSRKELLAQLEIANSMHVDNVRHIWESRNCGSCEELAEKHDALAATVEALRKCGNLLSTNLSYSNDPFADSYRVKWKEALAATPQQHLRDVEAKAGRAGFIAGFYKAKHVYGCELGQCATELDGMADEHAERVKDGVA